MCLDEFATWIDRITHQHVERAVRLSRILHRDDEQGPVLRVHRGLPELAWIHFTQTLIALETCLFTDFLDDLILLLSVYAYLT